MAREAETRFTANDQTKGAFRSLQDSFTKSSGIGKLAFAAIALGAASVATTITTLPGKVHGALDGIATDLDETAKQAVKLGTTAQELEAWGTAAEFAGASTDSFAIAVKTLSRQLSDAARGTGEGIIAFNALDIEVKGSTGGLKSSIEVLGELADKLPGVASKTQQVALAQKALGESGTELLPLLLQGKDALAAQLAEAQGLTGTYAELTAKGEEYADSQLRLNQSLRQAKTVIAAEIIPTFSRFANLLAEKLVDAFEDTRREFRETLVSMRLGPVQQEIEGLTKTIADYNRVIELRQRGGRAGAFAETAEDADEASAYLALAKIEATKLGLAFTDLTTLEAELAAAEKQLEQALLRRAEAQAAAKQSLYELMDAEAEALQQEGFGPLIDQVEVFNSGLGDAKLTMEEMRLLVEGIANEALPEMIDRVGELSDMIAQSAEAFTPIQLMAFSVADQLSSNVARAMGQMTDQGKLTAKSIEVAFKQTVKEIRDAIIKELVLTGLLMLIPGGQALLGAGGGGLTGFFGRVFGMSSGNLPGAGLDKMGNLSGTQGLGSDNLGGGTVVLMTSSMPVTSYDQARAVVDFASALDETTRLMEA